MHGGSLGSPPVSTSREIMPRSLNFMFGDLSYSLEMHKVDRSKLYGSKEVLVLDENESECELATLADDGRTMIGRGGTGLGWLDADGKWCEKDDLKPHDVDGDPVEPVSSSFSAPIKLFDTTTTEDYLAHNIRLVYRMRLDEPKESDSDDSEDSSQAESLDDLMNEMKRGTIFKFPYSYRGGLEADMAFLLTNDDDELMMVVGDPTQVAYIGIQSQVLEPEPEEGEEEDDSDNLMSFDMI